MPKSRTKFAAVLPRPPTPRLALSIPEFCEAHGISEGFFYKLKKQGEGPREMKVGARTLITFESAAEWRRSRETKHTEATGSRREQSDETMAGKKDGRERASERPGCRPITVRGCLPWRKIWTCASAAKSQNSCADFALDMIAVDQTHRRISSEK